MKLFELIKNVASSWQVIAVTLAILIYFFIVTQAAKAYRRPKAAKKLKVNLFKKKDKPAAAATGPEISESDANHVDDLGIEEG
jgi:flagellar biosynthesis/type III secretory pathway M-ring protein FliF/YscJ